VILVVDHHDSFTWNLVHCLARTGAPVKVAQSDTLTIDAVAAQPPSGIVLSPGPGRPEHAVLALSLVARFAGRVPLLGVCLGHQVLCLSFGARVVHASRLMHGRVSAIAHDGAGLFTGLPSPLSVARYHSLIVDAASLPEDLVPSAFSDEGELMAVRHRVHDIEGVQFHPESFLSEHGTLMMERWVARVTGQSPRGWQPATLHAHG
jgi:anthranilate synthase/aminodeoxychorismate synthase-like glutamine amidotransferase